MTQDFRDVSAEGLSVISFIIIGHLSVSSFHYGHLCVFFIIWIYCLFLNLHRPHKPQYSPSVFCGLTFGGDFTLMCAEVCCSDLGDVLPIGSPWPSRSISNCSCAKLWGTFLVVFLVLLLGGGRSHLKLDGYLWTLTRWSFLLFVSLKHSPQASTKHWYWRKTWPLNISSNSIMGSSRTYVMALPRWSWPDEMHPLPQGRGCKSSFTRL